MLSYCGLNCDSCPIYLATIEPDKTKQKTMREAIAELYTKEYGMSIMVEAISDCDGCHSDNGRLFPGCRNCSIRTCAMEKSLENCAHCDNYACDSLMELFQHDAMAKEQLDKIRNQN